MSNYEGYPQKSGGYQNRNNRYRDDHYQGRDNGGYRGRNDRDGDGGYRGRNDRDGGGYRGRNDRDGDGGYRGRNDRDGDGGYRGRNDRDGGGYRGRDDRDGGGYRGRDDRDGGGYRGRDDRDGGGYRGGGGGYRGRDDRDGGGYRGGGGGYRGRNDRDGGGYRGGGGGYRGRNNNNRDRGPRFPSHPIKIESSLFLLPDHPLTQKFQRAIGMAKGTIVEVDPRKKRGWIEIDGHKYKFEDERKKNLQKKYPIQKFLDREIQFAFWPTYSQKAAKYRKIDESPTIKIANLRQTLPEANHVEIIGQVLMVEESLFVMSIFSASQRKKYMVTIMGAYTGTSGDFIQMLGFLKDGGIHYKDHNVVLDAAAAAQNP